MVDLAVEVVDFTNELIPELLRLLLTKEIKVLGRCIVRRCLDLRFEVAVLQPLLRVLRYEYESAHHLLDFALLLLQ